MGNIYTDEEINEVLKRNGIGFTFQELKSSEDNIIWWESLSYQWKVIMVYNHNYHYRKFSSSRIGDYDAVLNEISRYDKSQLKTFIKEFDALSSFFCNFDEGPAIQSLAPIRRLQSIERLFIKYMRLDEYENVSSLINLKFVDFSGSNIRSLEMLANLRGLEHVNASQTLLNSVAGLEELTNLKHLNISDTPIRSLEGLQGVKSLEHLSFFRTAVNDLSPLQGLGNLKTIYCFSTQITSIDTLRMLRNIETINISNTAINDILPLEGNYNLKKVSAKGTPVTEDSITNLKKKMPDFIIEMS